MSAALTPHIVVNPILHAVGLSEFGWDSLVAIATVFLASVTVGLAVSTRKLARETGEDIRAGFRPVVIDSGLRNFRIGYEADPKRGACNVKLKNVGPGPAMNVRIESNSILGVTGRSSPSPASGTLGPGEPFDGSISDVPDVHALAPEADVECNVVGTYEDLAGDLYKTVLTYTAHNLQLQLAQAWPDAVVVSLTRTEMTSFGPPRRRRREFLSLGYWQARRHFKSEAAQHREAREGA